MSGLVNHPLPWLSAPPPSDPPSLAPLETVGAEDAPPPFRVETLTDGATETTLLRLPGEDGYALLAALCGREAGTAWADGVLTLLAGSGGGVARGKPATRLAITREAFASWVNAGHARLTQAEVNVAAAIAAGQGLSDIARSDGVSRETRRSQLRSLAEKLDLASQSDLRAALVSGLFALVARLKDPQWDRDRQRAFHDLFHRYVPEGRRVLLADREGHVHRLVDVGPIGGRPVVMAPPQILPDIRPRDIETLHALDLRLLFVLRYGAVHPDCPGLSPEAHAARAAGGIAAAIDWAGDRVEAVVGLISGAVHATRYARNHPEATPGLILVGAGIAPARATGWAGRLRSDILKRARAPWFAFSRFIDAVGKQLAHSSVLVQLLERSYAHNPSDALIVAAETRGHPSRMAEMFASSIESIKYDFHAQAHHDWTARPPGVPVSFIHGERDHIHKLDDVIARSRDWNAGLWVLPECGQLAYHDHFEPVMRAVRQSMDVRSARSEGRPARAAPAP